VATSNIKDPDAVLDFPWDWTTWLAEGETIETYSFTVVSGDVEVDADDETDGVVTAWLSGGTTRSVVTCHIVTSVGREDDRSRAISIRER
jgi:hypothetical protein